MPLGSRKERGAFRGKHSTKLKSTNGSNSTHVLEGTSPNNQKQFNHPNNHPNNPNDQQLGGRKRYKSRKSKKMLKKHSKSHLKTKKGRKHRSTKRRSASKK